MMHSPKQQTGATLIVVLIMVLLVTLSGIAAVRSLVIEERMAANSLDRSLAMQSLEQTLRYAEGVAQAQSVAPTFNADFTPYAGNTASSSFPNGTYNGTTCLANRVDQSPCKKGTGLCSQPITSCKPRWEVGGEWGTWQPAAGSDSALAASDMEYLIEYMGSTYACDLNDPDDRLNCSRYRITVRSKPGSDRAFVQLQSYYLALPKT